MQEFFVMPQVLGASALFKILDLISAGNFFAYIK